MSGKEMRFQAPFKAFRLDGRIARHIMKWVPNRRVTVPGQWKWKWKWNTVRDYLCICRVQGPIVGFTFGFAIENWELMQLGLKNEFVSLLMCVFFGKYSASSCCNSNICCKKCPHRCSKQDYSILRLKHAQLKFFCYFPTRFTWKHFKSAYSFWSEDLL